MWSLIVTEFPNWFEGQRYNFEEHLQEFKGQPNLRFLQLGAYTGDASVWLCDNILTGKNSFLRDIDTWKGSNEREHESINFNEVFSVYSSKIQAKPSVPYIMTTKEFFTNVPLGKYDFIYIDADHTADAVASDAEYSWELLKRGGILAFDDYMWGQDMKPELTPRPAIDNFLEFHEGEYTILTKNYQVWIKKNA
jgi:hypothetical protein